MHYPKSRHVDLAIHTGRALASLGIVAGMLCSAAPVQAEYPDHPITLVVPYAPGGGVDAMGRIFGKFLSEKLKQSVVVENRPGAGAMIGIDYVRRAKPDGATLLVVDPAFVINPSLQKQVSYKVSDFTPVTVMTGSPIVLVSAPATRFKSFDDMLQIAKSENVTYATPGVGTTPHMAGELLRDTQGARMTQVAYKGSGPATSDVLSGQVDVGFMSITAASAFLKDKRLKGLATTGLKRSEILPQLPTIAELTKTDYSVLFWVGLFAPAKLPEDTLRILEKAAQEVYADPAYIQALSKVGETPLGITADKAEAFVCSEDQKWSALIAKAHIKPAD